MPRTTTKKATVEVKKPTRARAPKRNVSSKEECARCSSSCAPEQAFWVNNGPVVDSLEGLKEAIRLMSDEQFAYHTTRAGNDFAAWVRDCYGDHACAVKISKAKTRDGVIKAITCVCVR